MQYAVGKWGGRDNILVNESIVGKTFFFTLCICVVWFCMGENLGIRLEFGKVWTSSWFKFENGQISSFSF